MKRVLSHDTKECISQRAYVVTHSHLLSAICCSLFHAGLWARLNWARQDLFGDLRVRNGIKLGLAGLLALFGTQMLRVPNDSWAILTVFVLMDAKYVGALAFKAIMRLTGTIVGALIGVWLVSDYASTPAIFLSVFFVLMVFAGYKVGQVGARQVPYAYYLLGLTTLTVASAGVTDPAQAWQTGLDRTEEIFIGIISSLLVSSLVWPRYAREEFLGAGRAALKTIGQLFSVHAQAYVIPANALIEIEQLHRTFDQQFSHLKNLLQVGARESTVFIARLAAYNAFMVSLTNLFHAGLDFSRHRREARFLEHVQPEMESLFAAISDEFDILTGSLSPGAKMRSSSMNETFAAFEEKLHKIRDHGMLLRAPLQTAMDFAGEFAVLRSVRDELNSIRNAMENLPRVGQPDSATASSFVPRSGTTSDTSSRTQALVVQNHSPRARRRTSARLRRAQSSRSLEPLRKRPLPEEKPDWDFFPTIDWFWVRVGIKGGLAAVIAIIFLKWIHPPGAANVPTWSWLFVILTRTFLQLSGESDLRGFQTALRGSLILVVCAILLILTTPFLPSYAIMNLVLFLALFAVGFLAVSTSGLSFWGLFAWLTIETFVGLNPQEPVSSQAIIDDFLGLGFGLWIATIVNRLLWPILPQKVLRHSLLALCTRIKALLSGDPHREKILTELAKLMVEALQAAPQIRIAGCSENEKLKLVALIHSLQMLVNRISQLVRRSSALRPMTIPRNSEGGLVSLRPVLRSLGEGGNLLPQVAEQIMRPQFKLLEIEFMRMLDAFAECFREGDCSREFPTVAEALTEMDQAVQQIRDRNLLGNLPPEASLRVLDLVDRYHASADALAQCGQILHTLRIERYWGDYGL